MPDALLFKSCQLASLGTGQPQFVNNDIMMYQALARGIIGGPPITLEDARDASPQGCFELVIPGKDSGYLYYGMSNLAACMEFVMTNGANTSYNGNGGSDTGTPRRYRPFAGIETGDHRLFKSFEEVQEAFRKQLAWMRRDIQIAGTKNERNIIEFTPTVYESALIDDCIEKGICREEGGAHYNFNNGGAVLASTDAGNSLTAIRKLVFDDKKITMAELCDASSPSRGMDVNGPTAVVKSMGKIDNIEILGGITFNLRIDPAVFKDGDVERMAALVRTFVDQKIFHMQTNVISSATLKAAQEEPDKYRDLVVKVAGYNAFFTQLSKPLQDSIIARTEHGL